MVDLFGLFGGETFHSPRSLVRTVSRRIDTTIGEHGTHLFQFYGGKGLFHLAPEETRMRLLYSNYSRIKGYTLPGHWCIT